MFINWLFSARNPSIEFGDFPAFDEARCEIPPQPGGVDRGGREVWN